MSRLEFHPLSEVFPLMEGEEFDALVADIKANGLREKIDLYQGKIVDGRNRYRALQRLGIDPNADHDKYFRKAIYAHTTGGEIAPHERGNDEKVAALINSKNIHRRHLTAEQKRDLIATLIQAQPEKSNRQIADAAGVSHTHINKVRDEMEKAGDVETVSTSIDTKGRKQPKKKKKPKPEIAADTIADLLSPEASAEATQAKLAALDDVDTGSETKEPPRAEVAKLVRAWVQASPETKREFIRERWDEISRVRKQLDANGAAHEDRWIEGDSL